MRRPATQGYPGDEPERSHSTGPVPITSGTNPASAKQLDAQTGFPPTRFLMSSLPPVEIFMDQPTQPVTAYKSVAEAALDLGHRTYSGTVAATLRRTEADETRR